MTILRCPMTRQACYDLDFQALMGDVRPLSRDVNRADLGRARRPPSEAQLVRRERAAAELEGHGFLSDDFVDLVPPFDPLEYRRDGIQQGVVDRL
ncbi:MAG: DNA endonuclease SmrA, partial [Halomonas sp.]|nr:DNA endonuclease SmrA [Halomonas sp.]